MVSFMVAESAAGVGRNGAGITAEVWSKPAVGTGVKVWLLQWIPGYLDQG